jgi:hypothetical protein
MSKPCGRVDAYGVIILIKAAIHIFPDKINGGIFRCAVRAKKNGNESGIKGEVILSDFRKQNPVRKPIDAQEFGFDDFTPSIQFVYPKLVIFNIDTHLEIGILIDGQGSCRGENGFHGASSVLDTGLSAIRTVR